MTPDRVRFLDIDFNTSTLDAVLNRIVAHDSTSRFAYLVTPNVDHLVRLAGRHQAYLPAYRDADVVTCDSRVVARLARMVGVALTVVPGSDLVAALLPRLAADRVCLIGGSEETAAALARLYPSLTIVQHIPPMGLLDNPAARARAIDFAAEAKARIILLAVGSPQQEVLADEMRKSGRVTGFGLCIGASVDFLTGAQTRAPRAVQQAGMEWAWRLASQPRRMWRRYLVEGPAIFRLVWRWSRQQKRAATP